MKSWSTIVHSTLGVVTKCSAHAPAAGQCPQEFEAQIAGINAMEILRDLGCAPRIISRSDASDVVAEIVGLLSEDQTNRLSALKIDDILDSRQSTLRSRIRVPSVDKEFEAAIAQIIELASVAADSGRALLVRVEYILAEDVH